MGSVVDYWQKLFCLSLLPGIYVLCKVTLQFDFSRTESIPLPHESGLALIYFGQQNMAKQCCTNWKAEPHHHVSQAGLTSWITRVLWPSHFSSNQHSHWWVRPCETRQPQPTWNQPSLYSVTELIPSWKIIHNCLKPLSFGMICYTAKVT